MANMTSARAITRNAAEAQSPLARIAGPLAFIAGALFTVVQLVLFAILDRSDRIASMAHPWFVPSAIANFAAYCLFTLALVAVNEWRVGRASVLGMIGFIGAFVGTLCMTGDMWFEAFVVPWIAEVAPEVFTKLGGTLKLGAAITYLLFTVGWVLFGIASLRARVFPIAIAGAILIGGAVLPWQPAPFGALLGLAFTGLGVWMLRSPNVARTMASPSNQI
jgi:hypothetical protein